MRKLSCDERADPVDRLVRDLTAEEMADWLIESHHLPAGAREVVVVNLREQYKWHRLQGRLDRHPTVAALAELWQLRQSSRALERPR